MLRISSLHSFIGDDLDFHAKLGVSVLLARVRPPLRAPTGDPFHGRMGAEECVAGAKVARVAA